MAFHSIPCRALVGSGGTGTYTRRTERSYSVLRFGSLLVWWWSLSCWPRWSLCHYCLIHRFPRGDEQAYSRRHSLWQHPNLWKSVSQKNPNLWKYERTFTKKPFFFPLRMDVRVATRYILVRAIRGGLVPSLILIYLNATIFLLVTCVVHALMHLSAETRRVTSWISKWLGILLYPATCNHVIYSAECLIKIYTTSVCGCYLPRQGFNFRSSPSSLMAVDWGEEIICV